MTLKKKLLIIPMRDPAYTIKNKGLPRARIPDGCTVFYSGDHTYEKGVFIVVDYVDGMYLLEGHPQGWKPNKKMIDKFNVSLDPNKTYLLVTGNKLRKERVKKSKNTQSTY